VLRTFDAALVIGVVSFTVKIISDKLRHATVTFGGFDTLLLQAK
jgi:hypothetical protein